MERNKPVYDRPAREPPRTASPPGKRRLIPPSVPSAITPSTAAQRSRRRWPWAVGAALAALTLGACATRIMPTPVIYRHGGADPFALVAPERRSREVEVFYATDRARTSAEAAPATYGTGRGVALRLGRATVRLGAKDADWNTLVEQTRAGSRPTIKIETVEEFGALWTTLPETPRQTTGQTTGETTGGEPTGHPQDPIRAPAERFTEAVNARLGASRTRDIVLHVPGFNTSFTKPIERMAGVAHMLSRDAVCIAYSWPSWDIPLGYGMQMVRARSSVRNLRELILLLAEHTDAEHIHIIAYSNGAQLATDALLQIRLLFSALRPDDLRRHLRIARAIYAAADEDLHYFQGACLDGLLDVAERTVVYTSRGDTGLDLSRLFVNGTPRLGQAREVVPGMTRAEGALELIDVGPAVGRTGGGDFWAHAYWYRNPLVSSDLLLLVRHGLDPERRALVPSARGPVWTFPPDYARKAAIVAREALPAP